MNKVVLFQVYCQTRRKNPLVYKGLKIKRDRVNAIKCQTSHLHYHEMCILLQLLINFADSVDTDQQNVPPDLYIN